MIAPELVSALQPLVEALDALGIPYRIGGSVASSVLGAPRSTLDVDLVCDLREHHVAPLVARLQAHYYVDGDTIRDAIRREGCFNAIHLATMVKVDVFALRTRPYDRSAFPRFIRRPLDTSPDAALFAVATAEDVILNKLEWFRLGAGVSDCQWRDVIGVLQVQAGVLDLGYLREWAAEIGVLDLLERALAEAAGAEGG
ncbi:MAG: hypothetical protein HY906_24035 [Deltaproteobacteria bacterium]|nr:hypothetical protein [Deltaproteobacteria bacterium]